MNRALGVIVALGVLIALGASATADPAARTRRDARAAFARGEAAAAAGRFDQALAAYEDAYALLPSPALLFDIAQAHRALGHHQAAIDALRAYLRTRGGEAERATGRSGDVCVSRACVEALIAELEDHAPRSVAPARIADTIDLTLPIDASVAGMPAGAAPGLAVSHLPRDRPAPRRRRGWWIAAGAAVVSAGAAVWWLARDRDPCGGVPLCVR